MSSNDGTRSTDAYENRLAHHFFPASLKLVDAPRRKFLGGMLSVNQANDRGEIIVSGIADSVAYDAKVRIDVSVDWNGDIHIDGGRLNSYRGQLGAYRRRAGASHGLLAPMTPGKVIARCSGRRAALVRFFQ